MVSINLHITTDNINRQPVIISFISANHTIFNKNDTISISVSTINATMSKGASVNENRIVNILDMVNKPIFW